ncbi:MAG: hypothetical protein GDA54_03235 [Alphaproteobacteria bacterium GM7ARS4]|nr:hypothetical protein [Alphaproteobacteria bacterium GM7ARS4]
MPQNKSAVTMVLDTLFCTGIPLFYVYRAHPPCPIVPSSVRYPMDEI